MQNIKCMGPCPLEKYAYGVQELAMFLKQYSPLGENAPYPQFLLHLDGSGRFQQEEYALVIRQGEFTVEAGSPSALLAGIYALLEKMGMVFSMNGYHCRYPQGLRLDLPEETVHAAPLCMYRGIRQHINFPMDISSYPVYLAQEYIRNLARMGYNAITFHSYTGQWHGYESENTRVLAGNYFYGQLHTVPEPPELRSKIWNREYYCIPEVEEILLEEERRSRFSVDWLRQVIHTAKEAQMHVTVSIELPSQETVETHVQICRNVLSSYPEIDALEWITPEGGGDVYDGEEWKIETLPQHLAGLFGDKVLEDGRLPYCPEKLPSALHGGALSLYRAITLYERRAEILQGFENVEIRVGLYIMCPETLRTLKEVMVRCLPSSVVLTFLPAHGSGAVAENIAFMHFSPEELARTMVYSWLEFDGNMYLLQNSSEGIRQLCQEARNITEGPVYGMAFNHWRTAENEPVASFAVKCCTAPLPLEDFYPQYGQSYGIGEPERFTQAMMELSQADLFNRDHLFNIGFCYLGCWLMYPGLGWIRGWSRENMEAAISRYQQIEKALEQCLTVTVNPQGIAVLRLFINRVQCSVLHIRAILSLHPLLAMADDEHPEALSPVQKDEVLACCRQGDDFAYQYLRKHLELLPDRGCQGTAVSYWATIPVFIDHIRAYFAQGEKECHHQPPSLDAPPPPDTAYVEG